MTGALLWDVANVGATKIQNLRFTKTRSHTKRLQMASNRGELRLRIIAFLGLNGDLFNHFGAKRRKVTRESCEVIRDRELIFSTKNSS